MLHTLFLTLKISSVGQPSEPFLMPLIPLVMERCGDKVSAVREAAAAAGKAIMGKLCHHAVPLVMPMLYEAMQVNVFFSIHILSVVAFFGGVEPSSFWWS